MLGGALQRWVGDLRNPEPPFESISFIPPPSHIVEKKARPTEQESASEKLDASNEAYTTLTLTQVDSINDALGSIYTMGEVLSCLGTSKMQMTDDALLKSRIKKLEARDKTAIVCLKPEPGESTDEAWEGYKQENPEVEKAVNALIL